VCGLKTDGAVVCWGSTLFGETGRRQRNSFRSAAGMIHTCGIKTDGTIACWGDNRWARAQLPRHLHPSSAAPATDFQQPAPSGSTARSCAGVTTPSTKPQRRPALSAEVSTSGDHACALQSDGTIVCWGTNSCGQSLAPSGTFEHVSAGECWSCAIRTSGKVTCWGRPASRRTKPRIHPRMPLCRLARAVDSKATRTSAPAACEAMATSRVGVIVEVLRRSPRCLPKSAWVAATVCVLDSDGHPWCWARKHASLCEETWTAGYGRRAPGQNVTHLLVHGFGVLDPEILVGYVHIRT